MAREKKIGKNIAAIKTSFYTDAANTNLFIEPLLVII